MAAVIYAYSNSGEPKGVLDYVSAYHEEDLDGNDRLSVVHRGVLAKRDRLVWKDPLGVWREHMVDSSSARAGSELSETTCSNSVSELFGAMVQADTLEGTCQQVMSGLLEGTRWKAGACGDFGTHVIETWHRNVRQCIAELRETCGGELETSVKVGEGGVESRTVRIVARRGSRTATRQFAWDRNMLGASREVGADEVYTRVVGYGAKLDAQDTTDYAERLTVEVDTGASLAEWGTPGPDGMQHNVLTYTDGQCTEKSFLLEQCRKIAAEYARPLVRYEFDAEDMSGSWSDVQLGDSVSCVDATYAPQVDSVERVSYIRRNLKAPSAMRIAVGRKANPMTQRFKAQEKESASTVGNRTRVEAEYGKAKTGGGKTYKGSGQSYSGYDYKSKRSKYYGTKPSYGYPGVSTGIGGDFTEGETAAESMSHTLDGVPVTGVVAFTTAAATPQAQAAQWGSGAKGSGGWTDMGGGFSGSGGGSWGGGSSDSGGWTDMGGGFSGSGGGKFGGGSSDSGGGKF